MCIFVWVCTFRMYSLYVYVCMHVCMFCMFLYIPHVGVDLYIRIQEVYLCIYLSSAEGMENVRATVHAYGGNADRRNSHSLDRGCF